MKDSAGLRGSGSVRSGEQDGSPSPQAFTPGPWEWCIHDYSMASLEGPRDDGDHVLSVSPCESCAARAEPKEWKWGRCTTPSLADARLIAAAPELLDALKRLCNECEAEFTVDGMWADDGQLVSRITYRDARDAIAKAEGRS